MLSRLLHEKLKHRGTEAQRQSHVRCSVFSVPLCFQFRVEIRLQISVG